ncbi:MAG: GTPase, partial [Paracoccaceae bacterium]
MNSGLRYFLNSPVFFCLIQSGQFTAFFFWTYLFMSPFARAPRGLRLHIGLFGRRNVGKSSILNRLTRQQVSIVSEVAGTTTDPVEKPMELLPIGPVLFIDTAG